MKHNKEDLIIVLLAVLIVLQVYALVTREPGGPTYVVSGEGGAGTTGSVAAIGGPTPNPSVVPPTPPPQLGVLYFDDYLKGIILLEENPDLALSQDQARKLLGPIRELALVYGAVPQAQTLLSNVLTDAQRNYISQRLKERRATPPPYRIPAEKQVGPEARQVLELLRAKTR